MRASKRGPSVVSTKRVAHSLAQLEQVAGAAALVGPLSCFEKKGLRVVCVCVGKICLLRAACSWIALVGGQLPHHLAVGVDVQVWVEKGQAWWVPALPRQRLGSVRGGASTCTLAGVCLSCNTNPCSVSGSPPAARVLSCACQGMHAWQACHPCVLSAPRCLCAAAASG